MEVNEIHKFLVCAHDINLLGDNTDTAEKNTETQLKAAKEVSLTLNSEKACRPIARQQLRDR
jgi:hypothetical protein